MAIQPESGTDSGSLTETQEQGDFRGGARRTDESNVDSEEL